MIPLFSLLPLAVAISAVTVRAPRFPSARSIRSPPTPLDQSEPILSSQPTSPVRSRSSKTIAANLFGAQSHLRVKSSGLGREQISSAIISTATTDAALILTSRLRRTKSLQLR